MKLGQALSVFEAALPEESAAPYREALTKLQEAAPPMPRGDRAPRARRAVRPPLARTIPGLRRDAGRRGQHRPGASRRLVGRSRGRGQAAIPRRGPGTDGRLPPAVAAGLAVRAACRPASRSSRCSPSSRSECSRSSTTRSRPTRSAPSPPRSPTIRRSRSRASWPARRRRSSPNGSRARRCRGSSPAGTTERTRPRRLPARRCCTTPRRRAPGCCTPTRTPATSASAPDGRLGVVDFGAVARLPDGSPEPLGRLTRYALDGDGERCHARDARAGLHPPRHRRRPPSR